MQTGCSESGLVVRFERGVQRGALMFCGKYVGKKCSEKSWRSLTDLCRVAEHFAWDMMRLF